MSKKLKFDSAESEIMKLLKKNYGVVGREFIRWLVKNRDVAARVVTETQERLEKEFESGADERYWTAANSCVVAATILLGKKYANIIDIPVAPIVDTLRLMVYSARGVIHGSKRTAEDVLNSYTREYFGKFVVIKIANGQLNASLGGGTEIDQSLTRSDVAGRVEHGITPGHIDYYIEEQLLKAHCVAMSYGYKDFKDQLEKLPHFKINYCRPDLLAKTRGPTMRVNVMKISRPMTEEDEET
jgi:hypothetical protein